MALDDPLQWLVIAVVAMVFLMWGPKKIPELARSIELAKREFSQASVGTAAAAMSSTSTRPGDPLVDAARKLNIQIEGRR